jgi:hypothetical protein
MDQACQIAGIDRESNQPNTHIKVNYHREKSTI